MKSEDEIQRAHDILHAVVTGEVPMEPEVKVPARAALDVLCWVLEHKHNLAFAANMAQIEAQLLAEGFVMAKATPNVN